MAFSYKAVHVHSSLTDCRKFPEPEVLTVELKKKGRMKGSFSAKVPVPKGKTAILTLCKQAYRVISQLPFRRSNPVQMADHGTLPLTRYTPTYTNV